MRHLALIGALCWLALCWEAQQVRGQRNQQDAADEMPGLFSFQAYKRTFHKHYSGLLEELARHRLLLGRLFESFVSLLHFRSGSASHYLRINHMSDDTPEERRLRYGGAATRRQANKLSSQPEPLLGEPLMTDERSIRAEFARIEARQAEPGFRQLAAQFQELRGASERRLKRHLNPAAAHRVPGSAPPGLLLLLEPLDPVKLAAESAAELAAAGKLVRRVPSNNPRHLRPELASSAPNAPSMVSHSTGTSAAGANFSRLLEKPVGTQLDSLVDQAVSEVSEPAAKRLALEPKLPDEMFVDHRKRNCFLPPKDQGYCGSCYAFTVLALYEYLFCLETNQLVAFSEQFMVDCGARANLDGCEGAEINPAMKFAEQFGLELAADYPYLGKNYTCPYDSEAEPEQMGAVRVDAAAAKIYILDDLDYFLERAPVATAVWLGPHFTEYGGGVDQGLKCQEPDEVHAMLIVGAGRENGHEYYLFRNSHGPDWGERGYYKLAKSAMNRCVYEPYIYVSDASFKRYSRMTRRQTADLFNRGPVRSRLGQPLKPDKKGRNKNPK